MTEIWGNFYRMGMMLEKYAEAQYKDVMVGQIRQEFDWEIRVSGHMVVGNYWATDL